MSPDKRGNGPEEEGGAKGRRRGGWGLGRGGEAPDRAKFAHIRRRSGQEGGESRSRSEARKGDTE